MPERSVVQVDLGGWKVKIVLLCCRLCLEKNSSSTNCTKSKITLKYRSTPSQMLLILHAKTKNFEKKA